MHMKVGPSIEPCPECREKYLTPGGVMLVEASGTHEQPEPTGSVAVLKEEAFKRIFPTAEVPPKRIALVEYGLLKKIGAV